MSLVFSFFNVCDGVKKANYSGFFSTTDVLSV